MSTVHGSRMHRHRATRSLITTARPGASSDFNSRQVFYFVTMAFRVVCFLAMIWVPSPWRWGLFFAAIILPGVAVMFANQSDQRSSRGKMETTTGTHFTITGSHIGQLEDGSSADADGSTIRDDEQSPTPGNADAGTGPDDPTDGQGPQA